MLFCKSANIHRMKKHDAIDLLGGSVAMAAEAIGIKSQAISQWPEQLPPRLVDRVQAALWRLQQDPKTSESSLQQEVAND